MRDEVAWTRGRAADGDLVAFVNTIRWKGWGFYMWRYDGGRPMTGTAIPPGDTFLPDRTGQSLPAFVAAHGGARHVFLVAPFGTARSSVERALADLGGLGYRPTARQGTLVGVTVYELSRSGPS
jgi:hypothetical protein